jgi:hypothetical protein
LGAAGGVASGVVGWEVFQEAVEAFASVEIFFEFGLFFVLVFVSLGLFF